MQRSMAQMSMDVLNEMVYEKKKSKRRRERENKGRGEICMATRSKQEDVDLNPTI